MELREITLADKPVFDGFLARFPPQASEYTFTNLFCWRKPRKHRFAILDDHLILSSGDLCFYQPVGPEPARMIDKLATRYPTARFERIEKAVAAELSGFEVIDDRAQWDYVYSVDDLRELPGQKYSAKRNFIRRIEKLEPTHCMIDDEALSSFLDLQTEWCHLRQCSADEALSAEDEAVREAITHFHTLGLSGVCVRIGGKTVAFAIGERLNTDTYVDHFEKASGIPGLYQYLLHALVSSLSAEHRFINREQDLGVEGLRKAKESYHPVRMVEKVKLVKR